MSRTPFLRALAALGLLFPAASAFAQLSYTGTPLTQDFNTLAASGTAQGSTLPSGWVMHESSGNTEYSANDGSSNSGTVYSYGTGTNTDRALGGVRSGSNTPTFGVFLRNMTGATLNQLRVQYTGEQWRTGARQQVDRLDFQYSLNATSVNDTGATWARSIRRASATMPATAPRSTRS
jgi:hypothetical protein